MGMVQRGLSSHIDSSIVDGRPLLLSDTPPHAHGSVTIFLSLTFSNYQNTMTLL